MPDQARAAFGRRYCGSRLWIGAKTGEPVTRLAYRPRFYNPPISANGCTASMCRHCWTGAPPDGLVAAQIRRGLSRADPLARG